MYKETGDLVSAAVSLAYSQLPDIDRAIVDEKAEQIVVALKTRAPDQPFSRMMALEVLLALYSFKVYKRSATMEAFARKVVEIEQVAA